MNGFFITVARTWAWTFSRFSFLSLFDSDLSLLKSWWIFWRNQIYFHIRRVFVENSNMLWVLQPTSSKISRHNTMFFCCSKAFQKHNKTWIISPLLSQKCLYDSFTARVNKQILFFANKATPMERHFFSELRCYSALFTACNKVTFLSPTVKGEYIHIPRPLFCWGKVSKVSKIINMRSQFPLL